MDVGEERSLKLAAYLFSSRGSGSLVDFGGRGACPAAKPELRKV